MFVLIFSRDMKCFVAFDAFHASPKGGREGGLLGAGMISWRPVYGWNDFSSHVGSNFWGAVTFKMWWSFLLSWCWVSRGCFQRLQNGSWPLSVKSQHLSQAWAFAHSTLPPPGSRRIGHPALERWLWDFKCLLYLACGYCSECSSHLWSLHHKMPCFLHGLRAYFKRHFFSWLCMYSQEYYEKKM